MCNTPGFPPTGQSSANANASSDPARGTATGTVNPNIVATPPSNDGSHAGSSTAPAIGSSSAATSAVVGGTDGASDPHDGRTVDYVHLDWWHPDPAKEGDKPKSELKNMITYYTDGSFRIATEEERKKVKYSK